MTERIPLCTVKACSHWKGECPFGKRTLDTLTRDEPFSLHSTPRPDCLWPGPEGTDNDEDDTDGNC